MKKKLLIVIVIAIIFTSIGCLFAFKDKLNNNGNSANDKKYEITYSEVKEIEMCKSDPCFIEDPVKYNIVKDNFPFDEVNNEIKKINKQTLKFYDEVKDSDLTSNQCADYKNTYNHSIFVDNVFYRSKTNVKYISLFAIGYRYDLCLSTTELIKPIGFNYDVDKKALLTQSEFRNKFGINESTIQNAVQKDLNSINNNDGTNYEYSQVEDSILYYIDDKQLGLLYYIPDVGGYIQTVIEY